MKIVIYVSGTTIAMWDNKDVGWNSSELFYDQNERHIYVVGLCLQNY